VLRDEATDIVRRMKSAWFHLTSICAFIRGRDGTAILPIDVKAVITSIDSDSMLQDSGELETEALEHGESVDFFAVRVELLSARIVSVTHTEEEIGNLCIYSALFSCRKQPLTIT
jgi:hypothetical protein